MAGVRPVAVGAREALTLLEWIDDDATSAAMVKRARIVLLSSKGIGPSAIADELGCSKQTVITWRERYRAAGITGLHDAPRSGRPVVASGAAIILRTLDPPPPGSARWTSRSLGSDLGVSNVVIAKAWRKWGVTPGGPAGVNLDTDPVLTERIGAVVGVHLAVSARVLAVRSGGTSAVRRVEYGANLLNVLLAGIGAGSTHDARESDALADFLARLDARVPDRNGTALRLLVDHVPELVGSWAATRDHVVLHRVPAHLSWPRISWVACQIAATSEDSPASAGALDTAMNRHRPGDTFSWTFPAEL